MRPDRRTVLVNVKVSEGLAIALADRAEAEGITQKQVITRALAAVGLPVDPLDLEDRTPRRRRAAGVAPSHCGPNARKQPPRLISRR
jgi:hypothetical protein